MSTDYQVTWRGIFHDSQGYAQAARGYVLGLDSIGVDVRLELLSYGTKPVKLDKNTFFIMKELQNKPQFIDKKQILVVHVQPWGLDIQKEKQRFHKVINNVVFEPEPIHNEWIDLMNDLDGVFVPSTHNANVFRKSGIEKPIFIHPHGVDLSVFKPEGNKIKLNLNDDYFYFLSVGTWSYRKALPELLESFWKEFSLEDKVCLILKTQPMNPEQSTEQLRDIIRGFKQKVVPNKLTAPVLLLFNEMSSVDLAALYRSCNCYVLPTRGEAVGLPYMEAMACGIPCIATAWGGQTDFINDNNGYLLDYQLKPVDMNIPDCQQYFKPYMRLAEPNTNHLKELLRNAYENKESVLEKGVKAVQDIQKWTWFSSAVKIKKSLDQIIES
jgi:glycosyltransferase involved in cell wall biosynthesis